MGRQYFCENERRRQAVRQHDTLNGIDYLEVLDRELLGLGLDDDLAESLRQRTLLVRCLKPAPGLGSANVRIEGGVRVQSIAVAWAFPATAIPAELVTPQEQAFFTGLPAADHVLVVRTASSGDFSTYRLRLVQSLTDLSPPTDFDRLLAQVPFTFKAECPSDFDCAPLAVCPPEPLPEPQISYLAKDYPSLRRLILDRLAVIMPDWQERNPADLGMALVELLAYAGDYLSYYQDAVATEAYLGTARKRISVRRHAHLLDYHLHEGCNARAWVCLEVAAGGAADGVTLAAGTRLLTQVDAPRGALSEQALATGLKQGAQAFETMHEQTLLSARNEMRFYTWGDDRCCLPRGATQATLLGSAADLQLQAGDVLIFEEAVGPASGQEPDADPGHRHAVRLDRTPQESVDALTGETVLDISWQAADALPFPLCLWQVTDNAGATRPVSVARGNVVLADAGLTVPEQALTPDTAPDSGRYRPQLPDADATHRALYDDEQARTQAAAQALAQDPRAALPAVTLSDGVETWTTQPDLLDSDRFAAHLVVEMDEERRGHLRFGDDRQGRRPAAGSQLLATYRVGNGRAGNVGAEAIAHVVTTQAGISNVRNPLPAQGGVDPEPLEQARLYAPQAFRTQERAVTEADYAATAQKHPEVQRAVATLRWTGSWHAMFVTVDRVGGRPVDDEFEVELRDFLGRFRLAGHDLEIEPPSFAPLDIALAVCVAPGYFDDAIRVALLEMFSSVDLPNGRRGFFHPDNLTFGQAVHLSQIIAAAMQTPGVRWVKPVRFQRWREAPGDEIAQGRIALGRLEIARLDNDPNAPENGKIEFLMEGGL